MRMLCVRLRIRPCFVAAYGVTFRRLACVLVAGGLTERGGLGVYDLGAADRMADTRHLWLTLWPWVAGRARGARARL